MISPVARKCSFQSDSVFWRPSGAAKIVYIEIANGGGQGDERLFEKIREFLRREFDAEVQAVEPA